MIRVMSREYVQEGRGFDCSLDDTFTLSLPDTELLSGLKSEWDGTHADFVGTGNLLTAFDPTTRYPGPTALLLRRDSLNSFLTREKLTVCWTVVGEKEIVGAGVVPTFNNSLRLSGAYRLQENQVRGFVHYNLFKGYERNGKPHSESIKTLRV
jgi:hypothetical protein